MALINKTVHFLHMVCQMLQTPSCALPLSLSPLFLCFPLFPSFFQLSTLFFFFLPILFIHLAFILVISAFEMDWLKSQLEAAASVVGFSVLYLLLHSSRSIAAFSGASACVNAVCVCFFSTDYLPMNMIKAKEHLRTHAAAAPRIHSDRSRVLLLDGHL